MADAEPQYEVLDDAGHKTGKILPRSVVHAQQLWHEVAHIWIVDTKGDVLLQLRSPDVELNPNLWDVAVGTHVRPGEDPVNAAQRALHDGLGIDAMPDKLRHLFNLQAANPLPQGRVHRAMGHVFLLKQDLDLAQLRTDPKQIAKLVWKPMEAVMADIGGTETAKQYLPRQDEYYPQLFDALLASAPPEMA